MFVAGVTVGVAYPCLAGQVACGLVISVALRPVIPIAALTPAGLSAGQAVEGIVPKCLGLWVARLEVLDGGDVTNIVVNIVQVLQGGGIAGYAGLELMQATTFYFNNDGSL